ncbi:S-layer homology domain-containing protein [[Eubacterium] tenue]|nr:IdeS/Mac family cysteine endopeptidase [[Eubacterium] tenue]MBC8630537.1 S-layer homology domain-containing protein [[Eubacterium] tenue]
MHKKLISSMLLSFILITPTYIQANPKLSDIYTHWAKKEINQFISSGYANGYKDGTFRPDNSITRAEFIKLVNKYFGFNNKESINFSDINTNDWYYNDICIAQKANYINGYEDKTFKPNKTITREEVAKILISIKNQKDLNYDKLNKYPDKSKVSTWAKPYIEGAIENGYLKGNDLGFLNPTNNITRAESITVLSRVAKEKTKIKDEVKNEPPVITANDLTINQDDKFEYSMLNAKAKDINGKNISKSIIYSGKVNTSKAGEYPIILTVKDDKETYNSLQVKVIVKSIDKFPIDNQNKLILQKILDDKTSNVKVHKYNQETIESYDVFSKGITPPSDSDFTILKDCGYTIPVAPYKPGMGWYDANKVFNGTGDDYLCSGATAANMLNWWMDQNSDYINKYLNLHGKDSTCIDKDFGISQNATISNFKKNPDDLFRYITKCFGITNKKGIYPDKTLFWFLNGHNLNYRLSVNKTDTRGGFFSDVFNDYSSIIDLMGCSYFSDLNYYLLDNLYHNKGIGISYHTPFGGSSHIVSLWGGKFDTNGNLLGVFITDSNDKDTLIDKSGNTYGMVYMNVVKEINSGKARLTNKITPNGNIGAPVLNLYTLDTGKSICENYFKSINSKKL